MNHIIVVAMRDREVFNYHLPPADAQTVARILVENADHNKVRSIGIVDQRGQAVTGPWYHNYCIVVED